MTGLTDRTEDGNNTDRLRMAGIALLVAFVGGLVTPLIVSVSNLVIEDVYEPVRFRDPATWMGLWWLGISVAITYTTIGIAVAVAVVNTAAVFTSSRLADLARIAGTIAVAGWLVMAAASAANYSTLILGDVVDVTNDATVRAMIGFAMALFTQGILGAASIGFGCWVVIVIREGRRGGFVGGIVSSVALLLVGAMAMIVFAGAGGLSAALSTPLFLLLGIALRRARPGVL